MSGNNQTIEELRTSLSRAIFMRESQQAAQYYQILTEKKPDFILAANLQYDLARLLELGNEPRLALHAYEQVLVHCQDSEKYFIPSLRGAGHLAYRLKHFKKCRGYLEKFLGTQPSNAEKADAEAILSRLPDGKGVREVQEFKLPQPHEQHTGDTSGGILLHQPQLDEPQTVSLDDVKMIPSDLPSTDRMSAEEAQSLAAEHVAAESPAHSQAAAKPSVEPPKSAEMWAVDFYGAKDAESSVAPSQPLSNYDKFGETPPLTISSRDIVKKVPNRAYEPENTPVPRTPPPPGIGWGQEDAIEPARFQQRQPSTWGTPAPISPRREESSFEMLRKREFAMLLPIGKRISLEAAAEVLRITEGLSDAEAKKSVLERKGLLREKMTYDELIEMYPKIKSLRKNFLFIAIDSFELPDVRYDVTRADLLEPGLRVKTTRGVKKARWENIRLISCGRLERQPTIDLFCNKTCQHLRLRDPLFDFASLLERPGTDPSDSCKKVLQLIVAKCPNAIQSHTVKNLLSGKTFRPQKFSSEDEYRRYNLCLLLTHFGETVKLRELFENSQAASSW